MSDDLNLPPSLRLKHLWPIEDKLEDARRQRLKRGGLNRPKLHSAQLQIKSEARRFNVAACGRRFGKSILAQDIACDYLVAGWPVGWFSPSYKSLADNWRELESVLTPVIVDKSVQEHRIELSTKGVLDCWSLDNPDAPRGRKYKLVIVDEAAQVRYLGEAWQAVIEPMLMDLKGDAWFLSTPQGANFFRTVFSWGLDDERYPEWKSWQMPSTANTAPDVHQNIVDEVARKRETTPERYFLQEYMAEFLDDAGGVFRYVDRAATAAKQESAIDGHSYVIGVDWGKYQDFTVLAVVDATLKELCYLDRFNRIDFELQMPRLYNLATRFKTKTIIPEHNSFGIPLEEQLKREGYQVHPFTTTNASKAEAIDSLTLAIEKGELKIIPDGVLIDELKSYEAERLPSGMLRYSAPEGHHDDCVIALALAWHGASIRPRRVLYA
jgi:hypothetical protein